MRTRASTLIARSGERRALGLAVSDAKSGHGSVQFIVGAGGVGKSRLVTEVVGDAAAAGAVVLRGRASSTGPMTVLRPFVEALTALQRRGLLPGPEQLDAYHAVLARVLPDLVGVAQVRSSESPIAFAEAVLRVLIHVDAGAGCVLVLEDLHDADDESWAVLEYLADNLADVPTAVLATLRDSDESAVSVADSIVRRGAGELLRLKTLARADMRLFAAACLDTVAADLSDELESLLWSGSSGNPLQLEELLFSLVDTGHLVESSGRWRLTGRDSAEALTSLARSLKLRIHNLGPQAHDLLATAALFGDRFPLDVLQLAVGQPDRTLLEHVHGAVGAQLLTTADRPDWYTFVHPVVAELTLEALAPAERRHLSIALARAVESIRPDLPEGWQGVGAELYEAGGQPQAAAVLLLDAGRQAVRGGNAYGAVPALERALHLHAAHLIDDPSYSVAEVLVLLVQALVDKGNLDRAREIVDEVAPRTIGSDLTLQAELHLRVAWSMHLAGRAADAAVQLANARLKLGDNHQPELRAQVDAVAVNLALIGVRDLSGLAQVEVRAASVGRDAEAVGAGEAACRAWHAVARIARERDLDESSQHFERVVANARGHALPIWVTVGLVGLAGNGWLADGDTSALQAARRQARDSGAASVALAVSANLGLGLVLTGEYDLAHKQVEEVLAESRRLGNHGLSGYATMTDTILGGHRGDADSVQAGLAELTRLSGPVSAHRLLAVGLGEAVGLLLASDDDGALRLLTEVARAEQNQWNMFQLAGPSGLRLLLQACAGSADADELSYLLSAGRGRLRWNRQFGELATAVLAGRRGDRAAADAAVRRWGEAAQMYPLARHVATRIVAERAAADGWGEPVVWLRAAEQWLHAADIEVAARGCRTMLRRMGAPVGQRRKGADELPDRARRHGVTVREYEVYCLVVDKHGNKAIGERLHISPRTVEKHIASLLGKLGIATRDALIRSERLLT